MYQLNFMQHFFPKFWFGKLFERHTQCRPKIKIFCLSPNLMTQHDFKIKKMIGRDVDMYNTQDNRKKY